MVSVPVDGSAFGVHVYFAVPVAVSPAPVSTEHETGPAVFNVAAYFASVNGSPAHLVRVPLMFIVWTVGVSVSPGESVTVPLLPVRPEV
jgi:hypothetical protein